MDNEYEDSKSDAVDINKAVHSIFPQIEEGAVHICSVPIALNIPRKIRNVSCFLLSSGPVACSFINPFHVSGIFL